RSGLLVAESYWHRRHGRTAEALAACEEAWALCWRNSCIVSFNTCVATELATALRLHAEALDGADPRQAERVRRRGLRLARLAAALARVLPPERPHALRELSLAWMGRGRLDRALRLASQSCRVAEQMNARYEYARSLLVPGPRPAEP